MQTFYFSSKKVGQTVGCVHVPDEPIHTAGRVYRHFYFKLVMFTVNRYTC